MGQILTDLHQSDVCSGSPTLREVIMGAISQQVSDLPIVVIPHLSSTILLPPPSCVSVHHSSPTLNHQLQSFSLLG